MARGMPFAILGVTSFDSADLNESQREQNNFEVLAYQKTIDDFSFQLSLFNSYSAVEFRSRSARAISSSTAWRET